MGKHPATPSLPWGGSGVAPGPGTAITLPLPGKQGPHPRAPGQGRNKPCTGAVRIPVAGNPLDALGLRMLLLPWIQHSFYGEHEDLAAPLQSSSRAASVFSLQPVLTFLPLCFLCLQGVRIPTLSSFNAVPE